MRRPRLIALVLLYLAAPAHAATTLTGWVSDESCGATHVKPGQESCVEKCLRGGASVGHPEWLPQRMVLVSDDGKTIWMVENPDALKGHPGEHVIVNAKVNQKLKSIQILRLRSK